MSRFSLNFISRLTASQIWKSYWLYGAIFGGTGLVVLLLVFVPYQLARQLTATQFQAVQAAHQYVSAASATLADTGNLGRLTPGRTGTVTTFANTLQDVTSNFNPDQLAEPSFILPPLTLPNLYPSRYVTTANSTATTQRSLRTRTRQDLTDTKQLFVHHTQVVNALVNILSYNASADFATFDLSSPDTQKRLQLAEAGLTKTRSRLGSLSTQSDPSLAQVTSRIDQLLDARRRLANGGSLDDWKAAVSLAQAGIVINRNQYWAKATAPLAERLAADAEQLSAAAADWQALLAGRLPH